jgi:hypothetical protein
MQSKTHFATLASLLGSHSVDTFLSTHWEQSALYVSKGLTASSLVTLAEIDTILTTAVHRHPDLTLVDAS